MSSAHRWEPSSEAAIVAAINDGTLVESHYFDVKREVGASSGERADLARHLASFAIDGGSLLIGVEEDKAARTWHLAPQPLDGLPERLEQIATQYIDPPLYTVARELPAAAGDGTGYLLVEVPPSPLAPHMVGGIYYGRGDRTRTRLSDAEVTRYHSARESQEQIAERLLDEEVRRDPQPHPPSRQCGRLYAVAQPLTAPRRAAAALIADQAALRQIVDSTERHIPNEVRAEPAPSRLSHHSRRAQGVAFSEYVVTGPGRTLLPRKEGGTPDEEYMLDLEFREDGGLRLLAGRLTALWRGGHNVEQPFVILDAIAVGYALRLVRWSVAVAERSGYRGSWVLGVHGSGMRGLRSNVHHDSFRGFTGHPFDAEDYREATTATLQEMTDRPEAVAERLVGRLTRALGSEVHWNGALGAG